jgi:His-Xaa-Ser system protein HxsD
MIGVLFFSMHAFLSQNSENNRLELLVDGSLFSDTIALKSAYGFLDRAYFFFRKDGTNTIVQICPKVDQRWSSEVFALEYSDELLATSLRDKLEKDNKEIRETIVKRALASYADVPNFRSIDTGAQQSQNQIDFDKDIDEILREIENDPDLKIDEEEITRILAEIEAETQEIQKQKTPKLDPNKLKDAKAKFQAR